MGLNRLRWIDPPEKRHGSELGSANRSGWAQSAHSTFSEPSRHERARQSKRRPRGARSRGRRGGIGLALIVVGVMLAAYTAVLAVWPLLR